MNQVMFRSLEGQLLERRQALRSTISEVDEAEDLARLLEQVDQALERLGTNAFGRCLVCGGRMDDAEMLENPLRQYCLCEVSRHGGAALQRDLDLAWQVQASLLPPEDMSFAGWQAHYRYLPAGPVSGDYCDIVTHPSDGGWMYFLVGDVSGKGVAASYLMAHLSALVRRTLDAPVTVDCLMETVNRHLSARSLDTHFVTLVAGRAHVSGRVEISNAGHCRPLLFRQSDQRELDSTGIPVGIDGSAVFDTLSADLSAGDFLVIYTDGISEARSPTGDLFGGDSLARIAAAHRQATPTALAAACLKDLASFQDGEPRSDDLTLMVLRRTENSN